MARLTAAPAPDSAWIRRTLAALVRFRSDLPEHRRPIAAWMQRTLSALGGRVTRHGTPAAPVLLARFGRGGVLFSGHLDTVPRTGEWRSRPGEVRAGRLYGRGSSDMKGGVTAILAAARCLAGRVPFGVIFTTDEEVGMHGAEAMLDVPAMKSFSALVVAEPTALRVGLAEKAIVHARLLTAGRSGHASMPWTGISATARMTPLLAALHARFGNRDRDGVTFNAGRLSGGVKPNVIPDACEALLDFRVPGARSPAAHYAAVRRCLAASGVPFRLEPLQFRAGIHQDEGHPALRRFLSVSKRPRGTVYFATEAGIFGRLGMPFVICGPGPQENAHITDEWVKLAEVTAAARIYRDFALASGAAR